MKLVWGNSYDGTTNYKSYEKKVAKDEAGGSSVQNAINNPFVKKNGLAAQKAEAKLREAEDKLLAEYRRQITEVEASREDDKIKAVKISGLNEKIKQIEDTRAQRELDAYKLELENQKREAEKQKRASEKNRTETAAEEEQEAGLKREDIEGMVKLSVSTDSLRELKRTKAMLKSEAKQLEIDIDNDFGLNKYGRINIGTMQNSFKHNQLNKLNKGVVNLESSIALEVKKMFDTAEDITNKKTDASKAPDISKDKNDHFNDLTDKSDDDKNVNDENAENTVDISL